MPPPEESAYRTDRRHRRQRARNRRIATWGATAVAAVAILLVVFEVIRLPGGESPRIAAGSPAVSTLAPAAAPTAEADSKPPRPLTVDDPLRLWIGGDSLAGSLGPSLGQMTAETGVVQPQFDSRVSSGLLNPGFFNWPKHAAQEMQRLDPEVVVFIVGANDYIQTPDPSDTNGVAAFDQMYGEKIAEMLDAFDTAKRTVYWVSPPVMRDSDMNDGVKIIQQATERELAKHRNVVYIDAYPILDDIPGDNPDGHDGNYTSRLTDPTTNKLTQVRAGDGIHLTADGGDLLAAAVFAPLDEQWHITEQAVPGHAKSVRQTPGSEQVPGTSRHITGRTVTPTQPRPTSTTAYRPPSTTTAAATTTSRPEPAPEPVTTTATTVP